MPAKARRQQRLISVATGVALSAASVAANATNKANTVSVPECKLGDSVNVTLLSPTDGVLVDGYVSSNGTVTIRLINASGGTVTGFAGTATVQCTRLF